MNKNDHLVLGVVVFFLLMSALGWLVERDLDAGLSDISGLTAKDRARLVKSWDEEPCRILVDRHGEPQLVKLGK